MNEKLQVLLAHGDPHQRAMLKKALVELGHEVVCECDSAQELSEFALAAKTPDLIVSGVDLRGGDGVQALVRISETVAVPAIIVTQRTSLEIVERAILDHVMAYLIEPVEAHEIKPTIHLVLRRFEQFQELQAEVESLRQALSERKTIERAKGVLMNRDDIDEDAAYKKLRRMATDSRIRLFDAAQSLLAEEA
jgi:AmiR/NasT family two-component response regulator